MTIDCVYYNPELRCFRDGKLERLFKIKGWKEVENTGNHTGGYNQIGINDKTIFRHRLIAYCFLGLYDIVGERGADDCIDHINGIKLDNRVDNLRITTQQGNHHNRTTAKGYYLDKRYKKWAGQITLNNKQMFLGSYDTEEEARQAYLTAKLKYHIH